MYKQKSYYYRNRDTINAKRRVVYGKTKSKTGKTILGKTNVVAGSLGKKTSEEYRNTSSFTNSIRLHALAVKYRITKAYSEAKLEADLSNARIRYSAIRLRNSWIYFFALNDSRMRLTAKSLTIWARERSAPISQSDAKQLESRALEEIEASKLKANTILDLGIVEVRGDIIERHIAFTNDAGAVAAVREKHAIRRAAPDGKQRFLVDVSTGAPETEFIHAKLSQPDAEKYAHFVEKIINDEYSIEKQLAYNDMIAVRIGDLISVVTELAKAIKERGL
jgi:hypothetical protein